jgi:hypothetical protein
MGRGPAAISPSAVREMKSEAAIRAGIASTGATTAMARRGPMIGTARGRPTIAMVRRGPMISMAHGRPTIAMVRRGPMIGTARGRPTIDMAHRGPMIGMAHGRPTIDMAHRKARAAANSIDPTSSPDENAIIRAALVEETIAMSVVLVPAALPGAGSTARLREVRMMGTAQTTDRGRHTVQASDSRRS